MCVTLLQGLQPPLKEVSLELFESRLAPRDLFNGVSFRTGLFPSAQFSVLTKGFSHIAGFGLNTPVEVMLPHPPRWVPGKIVSVEGEQYLVRFDESVYDPDPAKRRAGVVQFAMPRSLSSSAVAMEETGDSVFVNADAMDTRGNSTDVDRQLPSRLETIPQVKQKTVLVSWPPS